MLLTYLLLFTLVLTILMFVWGYFRYDTVALICLMLLVIFGIVPSSQAFSGFSNPAVITVAAVMVITSAINQTGLIDQILSLLSRFTQTPVSLMLITCLSGAFLSAFMNNIAALALLMPFAIQSAINIKLSPSKILMPLGFSTVLGGMTTKIGTPPNLLIANFRQDVTATPFSMFDYTPVGLSVAVVGILFIIFIGWRLVPGRRKAEKDTAEYYQIHDYISEVLIPENSPVVGMERRSLEKLIEGDFAILGLIRGRRKRLAISSDEEFLANDILIIEASHDDLNSLIVKGNLELVHGDIIAPESLITQDIDTMEAVVTPGSRIEGRSWQKMRIRSNYRINLLAIARSGHAIKNRLNHVNLNSGDVVLVQGRAESLQENIVNLGLVPLAARNIQLGFKRSTLIPLILFFMGILLATFSTLSVSVCFTLVVLAMVLLNVIPMRQVYQSIDWPIIILLGALIPLGDAISYTGTAALIAKGLLQLIGTTHPVLIMGMLLLITMSLSDIMNNSATAVVMSPIALSLAESLQSNVDPFLIAVGIGASCSFLTPISHQNNTLIMGPGSYHFFDYVRLGLPLELLVLFTSLPAIWYFWGL